jgi:uncharacterized protein YjbI with pentapeptide repeats
LERRKFGERHFEERSNVPSSLCRHEDVGIVLFFADLSHANLSSALASNTIFERASLFAARFDRTDATDASFEYSDLRNAIFINCNFERASFVGASLGGVQAFDCNFKDANFYWAETGGFRHDTCNFAGARFSEPVKIAFGPRGVELPRIIPFPLYREAITEEERRTAIEQAVAGMTCA